MEVEEKVVEVEVDEEIEEKEVEEEKVEEVVERRDKGRCHRRGRERRRFR